ncbi:MAG: 2TM domain-containing protein [Flavobacterium sp.]|nr:MAG: 2TM domain-containing protein [Flavobacterium sp.]
MELKGRFNETEDQKIYRRAKMKAQSIRGFYINLALYIIIIPMLVFINLHYTPGYNWFWFSMAGWGIGLIFHAMEAFDLNYFYGRAWEERKIQELLDKEKHKDKNKQ